MGQGKRRHYGQLWGLILPQKERSFIMARKSNPCQPTRLRKKESATFRKIRVIFGGLTVEENMKVAIQTENEETAKRMDYILNLFPDLKKFWKKQGGYLSGGQKQMLSIARAYVNENELLLIDEPSKGLAPIVVEKVMESILQMKDQTTIVLVEQNFMMASTIGDCFYIIDDGRTVSNGTMKQLKEDEEMKRKYLGIA